MSQKYGIIFDMDGTLWDSSEGVVKAWNEVIEAEYGAEYKITPEQMQSVMGKPMDVLMAMLFPALDEAARTELLTTCGDNENDYLRKYGGVLYDHMEETLSALCKDYHLYIVSNCQSGYIEAFLEHYGFEDYFEDIECFGNNGLQKGENIRQIVDRNELDRAVYVGDIQGDYEASLDAGILFIHAAYGFGDVDGDVPSIEEFRALPDAVDALFGK